MDSIERIRLLRKKGEHLAALRLAAELAQQDAGNAQLQYEAACVHDYLGYEAAAVPFYQTAIAAGLSGEELRSAYLGLGSTYRALGQYEPALATLDEGLGIFPEATDLKLFRTMALYNIGKVKEAVATLLSITVATSNDPEVQRYRKAVMLYAEDLDRQWQ